MNQQNIKVAKALPKRETKFRSIQKIKQKKEEIDQQEQKQQEIKKNQAQQSLEEDEEDRYIKYLPSNQRMVETFFTDYNKNKFGRILYPQRVCPDYFCQCIVCQSKKIKDLENYYIDLFHSKFQQLEKDIVEEQQKSIESSIIIKEELQSQKKLNLSFETGEHDYSYILNKLAATNKITKTLRINIPETVGFINGDALFIFLTQNKQIKVQKGIRNFFQDIRKKKLKEQKQNSQLIENDDNNQSQSDSNEDNEQQKQTTQIKGSSKQNNATKEFAIIKFTTETQVLNEGRTIDLLSRRKIDPIWKEVQYIQSYISPIIKEYELIRYKFIFDQNLIEDDPVLKRAQILVQICQGQIQQFSPHYVSDKDEEEFEIQLIKQDVLKYLQYICYQMAIYAKDVHKVKFHEFLGEFLRDDNDIVYFINANQLIKEDRRHYLSHSQIMAQQNEKNIDKKELILRKKLKQIEKDCIIEFVCNILFEQYNALKKIDYEFEYEIYHPKQILNQEIFQMILPECKYKIKDLVRIRDCKLLEKILVFPMAKQLENETVKYMIKTKEKKKVQLLGQMSQDSKQTSSQLHQNKSNKSSASQQRRSVSVQPSNQKPSLKEKYQFSQPLKSFKPIGNIDQLKFKKIQKQPIHFRVCTKESSSQQIFDVSQQNKNYLLENSCTSQNQSQSQFNIYNQSQSSTVFRYQSEQRNRYNENMYNSLNQKVQTLTQLFQNPSKKTRLINNVTNNRVLNQLILQRAQKIRSLKTPFLSFYDNGSGFKFTYKDKNQKFHSLQISQTIFNKLLIKFPLNNKKF